MRNSLTGDALRSIAKVVDELDERLQSAIAPKPSNPMIFTFVFDGTNVGGGETIEVIYRGQKRTWILVEDGWKERYPWPGQGGA